MKRKVISILVTVFIITVTWCAVPIYAENDVMDYLDISEEVMTALKKQDDTDYIKTYGSCGLEYLHETTMQEIIEEHDYQEYYYSMKFGLPCDRYLYGNNKAFKKTISPITKSFLIKCLDFDNIESSISGNAKITNCYICDDTVNYGGLYCYYETTKGNYILFRQVLAEVEPLYLVPEEEFKEISKQYVEIMKENSGKKGGIIIDMSEHIDMSKYKYHPYQNLIIILSVVGVVAVAAVVGLVIWRKKKKAQKVQKTTAS